MELRTANVVRYIMPLEGGSLPALAEADDEYKYVVKFREPVGIRPDSRIDWR